MPLKPVDLEQFIRSAKNVHEAIVAASKRARQINEELKIEFNQRIEMLVPRTESESEENEVNPDQLNVAAEFEKRPKPTDAALEELMQGKVSWRYKEREQIALPEVVEEEASDDDEE
jgi:DNA-directed RNA polymerase subunit K/omega